MTHEDTTTPTDRKLYEVINPSDAATFWACSDNVAVVAMLMLDGGRGAYAAKSVDGAFSGPVLMIHGSDWLRDHGIWPVEEWIDLHTEEIASALESVALGDQHQREDFDDACRSITDPTLLREFIKRRNDRRRSSLNDFESYAHDVANRMREKTDA